ncbi:MAG TPA: hypothetical protein VJQ47_05435 [Steroidobacteraceae bacterium]|nr:hypothetical protein [Steroidobacteraceae bacterium]
MRANGSHRRDGPEHVTPYDRFAFNDVDIERLLLTGDYRRELVAYFGEQEYRELVELAHRSQANGAGGSGMPAIIVPGIMGSQLGLVRPQPLPNDILWLDPIDIQIGRLEALRLEEQTSIVSLGVVLYSHLRLKLHLRAGGFAPVFHDYDWRLGVDSLGKTLAERICRMESRNVAIVAHSMGGLVTRAALTHPGAEKVERAILLGTPNFGSFAAVQALRGTYAVVRKIARLSNASSAENLAGEIFNSFPSLYHMLPHGDCSGGADLFAAAAWPQTGPRPRGDLLQRARGLRDQLAHADERLSAIVGVGQETVTGVARRRDDFVYTVTRRGDGTVPAVSAALPGVRSYYTPLAHSELTRDRNVAAAVIDLLKHGDTDKLPAKWQSHTAAEARISDTQLRRTHAQKVDWAGLEPEERRIFLQNLNEPPKLRLRVPAAAGHAAASSRAQPAKARRSPRARTAARSTERSRPSKHR